MENKRTDELLNISSSIEFVETVLASAQKQDYISNSIHTPLMPMGVIEENNGINTDKWIKWIESISSNNADDLADKKDKLFVQTRTYHQFMNALLSIDQNFQQSNNISYSTIEYFEKRNNTDKRYIIVLLNKQVTDAKDALKSAIVTARPAKEYLGYHNNTQSNIEDEMTLDSD